MVTIQVSFLLRRLRTLLANDSRKRARVPARGTPTIRRAGLPSRRIVGTGLAPVLAVTPLRLGIAFSRTPPRGLAGPLEPPAE